MRSFGIGHAVRVQVTVAEDFEGPYTETGIHRNDTCTGGEMVKRAITRPAGWIMPFMMLLAGCASTGTGGTTPTRVIAVFEYRTEGMTTFRAGGTKPRPHIIWGNDIPDETPCRVLITHINRATTVWEHIFTYNADALDRGLNYQRGAVIEIDKDWNLKPGKYLVELYARHRRVARSMFTIIP